jgi:hypothetical protein
MMRMSTDQQHPGRRYYGSLVDPNKSRHIEEPTGSAENPIGGFEQTLPDISTEVLQWALNHGRDKRGNKVPPP